jgi:hypothetical protein
MTLAEVEALTVRDFPTNAERMAFSLGALSALRGIADAIDDLSVVVLMGQADHSAQKIEAFAMGLRKTSADVIVRLHRGNL